MKMLTNFVTFRPYNIPHTDSVPQVKTLVSSSMFVKRIRELLGLQGLAVLQVPICDIGFEANSAASHRWLFCLMGAGALFWSGVGLLFVLSGFLIRGVIVDAQNSPNYFKAFHARRFFRIIPIHAGGMVTSPIPAAPNFFDGVTL